MCCGSRTNGHQLGRGEYGRSFLFDGRAAEECRVIAAVQAHDILERVRTESFGRDPLLLDSLSTFTSYELCTYSNLVVYAVLTGSVSLKRVDFKSKVVDAPEIKAILGDGEDKLLALSGAISAGPGADADMQDAGSAPAAEMSTSRLRMERFQPAPKTLPSSLTTKVTPEATRSDCPAILTRNSQV